jgi:hypothetical protein
MTILYILLALLGALYVAGMVWAGRTCGGASDAIGWMLVVLLVLFWPLLWLARHVDWPVQ